MQGNCNTSVTDLVYKNMALFCHFRMSRRVLGFQEDVELIPLRCTLDVHSYVETCKLAPARGANPPYSCAFHRPYGNNLPVVFQLCARISDVSACSTWNKSSIAHCHFYVTMPHQVLQVPKIRTCLGR
jgi:hypothetical protein